MDAEEDERLQRLVTDVALDELGEDQNSRDQGLKDMLDWVNQHPEIVNCRTDANFLLRFLRVKKYDLTRAQQMLFNFIDLTNVLPPSFFGNHDVAAPSVVEFMCDGFYFVSPNRDDKGREVILLDVGKLDLDRRTYTYDQLARTVLLSNFLLQEDEASQVLGYTYVLDVAKVNLAHLALLPSPIDCIRFLKSGEAALPMRNKEVHILHLPVFLTWIVNLLKSALTKKLRKRIKVHSSLASLHRKVSPRVLPKEYGGETPLDDMIAMWKVRLLEHRETVMALNDMKVVRKQEPKRHRESEDLQKSFRNLQID